MKDIKQAYTIIYKVKVEGAYANLLMQNLKEDYNIGYITQLVYGTLRNYRLTREGWKHFVKGELSDEISSLLDLGVYMLMDIKNTPDYAIVNNIVEISKDIEYGKYTNLTNAVLKRFIKEGIKDFDDSLEEQSLKYSNPLWLSKMWKAHYGIEKTKKMMAYNNTEASLSLRVNPHKIKVEDLLSLDPKFKKGLLAAEEVYYDGNIFSTDYLKNGYVSIQDPASQKVAHVVNANAKDKVLDTCSAPGTKSIHIASLRYDKGSIDAVEVHDQRAVLIKNEARRLGLKSIKVYTHDARYLEEILKEASYDKVLVDAPCSGFGVMRAKPEIKIRTKPEDLDSLVILQSEILASAAKMTKVSGNLIYSTCTVNKKENEGQVKKFLEKHPNFELLFEETIFGYETQSDSFYIAKLKKLS